MKKKFALVILAISLSAGICGAAAKKPAVKLDQAKIEELTGAKGTMDSLEDTLKVTKPRDDLSVSVGGMHFTPPMGLSSWAAFKPAGDKVMAMGDLVLTEDQVAPVMNAALDNGLEVTALHNHFAYDSPRVMFMHVAGMDEQEKIAGAIGRVFEKIQATSGGKGQPISGSIDPAKTSLDPKKLDIIFTRKGEVKDGVYRLVFRRLTNMHGREIGESMGVASWAAFAGSDDSAAVDGDFAVREEELQDVLKALRGANINVVAIHQHMTGEKPRIIFLHYIGVGKAEQLAKGLNSALDKTRTSCDSR